MASSMQGALLPGYMDIISDVPSKKRYSMMRLCCSSSNWNRNCSCSSSCYAVFFKFTSGGIATGSYTASLISTLAPTAPSGVVATFQSLGAAGVTFAAKGVAFGTGATVGECYKLWQ